MSTVFQANHQARPSKISTARMWLFGVAGILVGGGLTLIPAPAEAQQVSTSVTVVESVQVVSLRAGRNCRNIRIRRGANLRGCDLRGADLRRADLRGANLRRANLRGANLRRANLRGANLTRANLRRANLTSANFRRASLRGTNLTRTNLRRANLTRTNLRGANLRRASLRGANFRRANLTSANFRRASLRGTNLTHTNLRRANLTRTNLRGASLRHANLTRVVSGGIVGRPASLPTGWELRNGVLRPTCANGGACSIGNIGPGGGTVFYDAGSRQTWGTYLEAADSTWSGAGDPSMTWGAGACRLADVPGTGTAIGAGFVNTAAIIRTCRAVDALAAWSVQSYSGGDKTDWYLASRDELSELFLRKGVVGGFIDEGYWSSSQFGSGGAWVRDFLSGASIPVVKSNTSRVRPIRAF